MSRIIHDGKFDYLSATVASFSSMASAHATFNESQQAIQVSQISGNDTTGNGTQLFPYATIDKAISVITDSSATKPYYINVNPGIYTIDNSSGPLTLPSYCNMSASKKFASSIRPTDENQNMFTISNHCIVKYFIIRGPTGASAFSSTNKSFYALYDMHFSRGLTFLTVVQGGPVPNSVFVENIFCNSTGSNFIDMSGGAVIRVKNIESLSKGVMFNVRGAGTILYAQTCRLEEADATNTAVGITISDGAFVEFFDFNIVDALTGISISDNTSIIKGSRILCNDTDVTNHLIQSGLSLVEISSSAFNQDKISISNPLTFKVQYIDTKVDNRTYRITDELSVGIPEIGKESEFGEGNSYTRGMLVYTYDGASYVNVTSSVKNPNDALTITFPNTLANTAIYVCSTLIDKTGNKLVIQGIKLTTTSIGTVGAISNIVFEYYNGAIWSTIEVMTVSADGLYLPYANNIFPAIGGHQIRFNNQQVVLSSLSDDPIIGTTYHWFRIRITAPIVASPIIDQIKLHPHRTEFNEDGSVEYFGKARPIGRLPITWGNVDAAGPNPPGDTDITYTSTTTLRVGRLQSLFINGAAQRVAMTFISPLEIDTSCPLKIRILYIPITAASGDVELRIYHGLSKDGDTINGVGSETVYSHIRTITNPANINTQMSALFDLEITDLVAERVNGASGDLIWFAIYRDSTAGNLLDTYAGSVAILDIGVFYTKWREGGHINNWL